PPTYGHLDLIERGSKVFDELIVAIGENPFKTPLFTVAERRQMIQKHTQHLKNVKVDAFKGMLVDYVQGQHANIILRGIRTVSDFEEEFQRALTNRVLKNDLETVFIMTSEQYSFLNSRLIKEAAILGGDVSKFVPPEVEKQLIAKLKKKTV
ncbi:MAG: pantetheine-phosphate adenylyltransferase, partial [Planctomycetota bacterium]